MQRISERQAASLIMNRATAGLVAARAERFLFLDVVEDAFDIPANFWCNNGSLFFSTNWLSGDFSRSVEHESRPEPIEVSAFGVTFRRCDIERLVRSLPVEVAAPVNSSGPSVPAGGRPPKSWWDDLWIDIARQLYNGDLKPVRQADIERAMSDWVTANGHDASPSTLKPRAAKLWRALEAQDKN